jgi:hypothetical protein
MPACLWENSLSFQPENLSLRKNAVDHDSQPAAQFAAPTGHK